MCRLQSYRRVSCLHERNSGNLTHRVTSLYSYFHNDAYCKMKIMKIELSFLQTFCLRAQVQRSGRKEGIPASKSTRLPSWHRQVLRHSVPFTEIYTLYSGMDAIINNGMGSCNLWNVVTAALIQTLEFSFQMF